MINSLSPDMRYHSLKKHGEPLCGDNVAVVEQSDGNMIVVLADGLGSGVKANILSKLTAQIISTMMANDMSVEDCVKAMAATLPVCEVRRVAYSTFTIIRIVDNSYAEIIEYDNPEVVLLRDGKPLKLQSVSTIMDGKKILRTELALKENDTFVAFSDGVIHAGVGRSLPFGWTRNGVIKYLTDNYDVNHTAEDVTSLILDKALEYYGGTPEDDTTVCAIKLRKNHSVNVLIGPPSNPGDLTEMLSSFFALEGERVVCGGTISTLAADFLGKTVKAELAYHDPMIPPIGRVEGIDLVTEGVVTLSKVLEYSNDYLGQNEFAEKWKKSKDAASLIARLLLEKATEINFYIGKAVNPAHQSPSLPIGFNVKMRIVEDLIESLRKMGKKISVKYF